jgi:hypothetical protein
MVGDNIGDDDFSADIPEIAPQVLSCAGRRKKKKQRKDRHRRIMPDFMSICPDFQSISGFPERENRQSDMDRVMSLARVPRTFSFNVM